MHFHSTWAWLLLLCLVSPNIAFKNIRPCYASNTIKSSLDSLKIDKNLRFRTITGDLKMAPRAKLEDDLMSTNAGKLFSMTNAKKFAMSSTIVALMTLGLQQSASAGVLEILQEKAQTSGFLQSFLLIFVSEIGDKTFFIAGLLAAKYNRLISFTGSIGALAVMTVISTVLGQLFNAIPEGLTQGVPFADYVAVVAFTYFGFKTLYDASQLSDGDNSGIDEEKEDAEKTVEELEKEKTVSSISRIVQTFTVVFAAEIGDRSFLSTIALSAANNPFAVATGAIAAHASATGIAVLGGSLLAKYLSEKVIGYIGGSLFVIFAITTAIGIF